MFLQKHKGAALAIGCIVLAVGIGHMVQSRRQNGVEEKELSGTGDVDSWPGERRGTGGRPARQGAGQGRPQETSLLQERRGAKGQGGESQTPPVQATTFGRCPEDNAVCVAIRVRNPVASGTCEGELCTETAVQTMKTPKDRILRMNDMHNGGHKDRAYDVIFPHEATPTVPAADNSDVYEALGEPTLDKAFGCREIGKSCQSAAFFAYGGTGSGKSYTMGFEKGSKGGLMQYAVKRMFEHLDELKRDNHKLGTYTVYMAFYELYGKTDKGSLVNDLLSVTETGYKGSREVVLAQMTYKKVTDPDQFMQLFDAANDKRAVGGHSMNAKSSRSHAVVQLFMTDKVILPLMKKVSQGDKSVRQRLADNVKDSTTVMFVDLAGSEDTRKWPDPVRQAEGRVINKGLAALQQCIAKLADPKKNVCSDRDDMLPQMLKGLFEKHKGRAKAYTRMLATVNPSADDAQTVLTTQTLKYASKTKDIKIKIPQGKVLQVPDMNAEQVIAQLQAKVKALEDQLKQAQGGSGGDCSEKDGTISALQAEVDALKASASNSSAGGGSNAETQQELKARHAELQTCEKKLKTCETDLNIEKSTSKMAWEVTASVSEYKDELQLQMDEEEGRVTKAGNDCQESRELILKGEKEMGSVFAQLEDLYTKLKQEAVFFSNFVGSIDEKLERHCRKGILSAKHISFFESYRKITVEQRMPVKEALSFIFDTKIQVNVPASRTAQQDMMLTTVKVLEKSRMENLRNAIDAIHKAQGITSKFDALDWSDIEDLSAHLETTCPSLSHLPPGIAWYERLQNIKSLQPKVQGVLKIAAETLPNAQLAGSTTQDSMILINLESAHQAFLANQNIHKNRLSRPESQKEILSVQGALNYFLLDSKYWTNWGMKGTWLEKLDRPADQYMRSDDPDILPGLLRLLNKECGLSPEIPEIPEIADDSVFEFQSFVDEVIFKIDEAYGEHKIFEENNPQAPVLYEFQVIDKLVDMEYKRVDAMNEVAKLLEATKEKVSKSFESMKKRVDFVDRIADECDDLGKDRSKNKVANKIWNHLSKMVERMQRMPGYVDKALEILAGSQ